MNRWIRWRPTLSRHLVTTWSRGGDTNRVQLVEVPNGCWCGIYTWIFQVCKIYLCLFSKKTRSNFTYVDPGIYYILLMNNMLQVVDIIKTWDHTWLNHPTASNGCCPPSTTHFPPWINSFEHPTQNPLMNIYTMYDAFINGESSQPEVSDQSQTDRFHQWGQLSLCLHHFLPRDSEEHWQQRDLSGGPCSNVERPVGFLLDSSKITTTVRFWWNFKKICSGPRRIWERFARPRHLYQKTWAKVFQSLLTTPYLVNRISLCIFLFGFLPILNFLKNRYLFHPPPRSQVVFVSLSPRQ